MKETNPVIRVRRRLGRVRRWIKRRWWDRLTGRQYRAWLQQARMCAPGTVDNPVAVSILVPVFNPPVRFLEECIGSVRTQTARNWQVIVIDDGSTDPDVRAYLDDLVHAGDPRIVVLRERNGGISSALNAGLARVGTSHVGWLDHDDLLDPRCIAEFSEVLAVTGADIVYSDEDKVDERGRHFELYCKPNFSPELLLTQMYLCHFTVFPTEALRAIGGFRSSMDGAQDFDAALRLLPHVTRVEHIPHPLYHWRWWSGSTSQTIEAKPWALDATQRVQRDYLETTFGGGEVVPGRVRGLLDIHPRLTRVPQVAVIIPTIGARDSVGSRLVDTAIASLRDAEARLPLEIIVVTTGEIHPIPEADRTIVYRPEGNFNFAEAVNIGRSAVDSEYLFLLNDDTQAASHDPISTMMELGQIAGVGITGAALDYPDGRIQHAGIILIPSGPTHCWIAKPTSTPGYFGSTLTPRNFSAVTAAAMLVRTEAFDAVDGFDTRFARDFNDVDFCLRVGESGLRTAWTPYARFLHHEGRSLTRRSADPREAAAFGERWAATLVADPFYSPSLHDRIERLYEPR